MRSGILYQYSSWLKELTDERLREGPMRLNEERSASSHLTLGYLVGFIDLRRAILRDFILNGFA